MSRAIAGEKTQNTSMAAGNNVRNKVHRCEECFGRIPAPMVAAITERTVLPHQSVFRCARMKGIDSRS
jgi:hypothetical protein